jgi:inner membrane protein
VATVISHSIAALVLGKVFPSEGKRAIFWVLTAICAALPDIDVIGFHFGIRYRDMLGHRGLTHSLPFAFVVGCLVTLIAFRNVKIFSSGWWKLSTYLFVIIASHGVLDAMTNGGLGVAFFAPFSNERYFFPWRPIEVSPLGIGRFLSEEGLEVIISEVKWIWIPSGLLVTIAEVYRRLNLHSLGSR